MSWSNRGNSESLAIRDACVFAYKRNCVLVASAGNSGSTSPRAPADWEDESVDVIAAERNATQTSSTAASDALDMAMADSVAHIAWVEHNPGDSDCYYRALKAGARRNGMFVVSSNLAGTNAVSARVDADGDYVHVAWEQNGGGGTQIMHRRNTSRGDSTSWSNSATLRNLALGVGGDPDVAVAGRYVYVAWGEQSGANREIMMRRNQCNGHPQGWEAAAVITDAADALVADEPRVAAGGEGVDVVWSCYNGSNFEIYDVYSVNHGTSYSSQKRVTFNAGGSYGPSVECAPGWGTGQVNYVYLVWNDNSHSSASSRIRFKQCEPRFIASFQGSSSYDFDHHDLSGWGMGQSGGGAISITPGLSVSPPNALLMNSQIPGYAWVETPANPIDLTQPYWLSTWLYLDGTTNDGIVVMDNSEIKLDIISGTELVSGTGDPIEVLYPYTWYLIECCADPSPGMFDVYVNEKFKMTCPLGGGPATQTILLGDVIDAPAGYAGALGRNVAVNVFDASGRLVRTIADVAYEGRRKILWWDGRTGDGSALPSGAYFISVRTDAGTGGVKVVILR
jgi:hypothetical protein